MSDDLPAKTSPLDAAMKRAGFVPADQASAEHPLNVWLEAMAKRERETPPTHTTIMVGNFQEGYRLRVWCDKTVGSAWVTCSSTGEIDPAWRCPSCGLIPGREKEGLAVETNDVAAWPALEDA